MEVRRKQSMPHLVFSEPFDTLFHSILNCKVKKYCLAKQTFGWTENCLNCWATRAGISDSLSTWHPTASEILQGYDSLYHAISSSETWTMRQSTLYQSTHRVSIFSVGVKLAEWLTPQNAEFPSSRTFKLKEWPTEVSRCFSGKHRALQKWWNNLKNQYKLGCEELCGSPAKVYFL